MIARSDLFTLVCWAVLAGVAPACGPGAATPPAEPSPLTVPTDTLAAVTLYRSPCSSRCPVYSVSVTPEGMLTYRGTDNVFRLGIERARVSPAEVERLVRELEGAGYFLLPDRYRPSEPVCGRYVPDSPTVITTLRVGRRIKQIEHDHGCGGAPMSLRVMESRIDEALGTGRWTGS
jgi:Domain of unknown function (DUF6438)